MKFMRILTLLSTFSIVSTDAGRVGGPGQRELEPLDAFESFDSSVTPNSLDEDCNPKLAGCGENANCGVHNGESICTCPGLGAVPKGQNCDLSAADLTVSVTDSTGGGRELSSGAFTVIFMADMENQYRNHHDDWCYNIAEYVKNFGSTETYFDNYPSIKVDPELVIHGGDLSDTTYHWDFTADDLFDRTYQQFYDAGIPLISVLGNHDETNGIPHSEADSFVRNTFQKSEEISSDFSFDEIATDSTSKNSYYVAQFKGLQIATVNDALESTGSQWTTFQSKLDTSEPALFFSHRPLGDQKSQEAQLGSHLINYISTFPNPTHYAGHDHQYYTQSTGGFTSYIAPYLHKKETSVSGVYHPTGFLALLVSPTQGVMETKVVHYDYEEVTGCWADGSVCGAGSSCKYCCHSNRNAMGTQCGGAKWPDGTLCGDGTTCDYCENDFEYWDQLSFTACGSEPCWSRGSRCGAGTTCNNCCDGYSWWWSLFFTACD